MRRASVAIALGAAALLVAGLSMARIVLASDDRRMAEPISVDAFYAVDGPLTCDSEVKEVPTLPLEANPVALLICADPQGSMPWTAPLDLVEGDLTGLVEALSDLERAPEEDYACTMQAGPGYDLLLQFSRGRFARIHGQTEGCGVVTTAAGEWFGAQDVLDEAIAAVEAQRSTTEPPATIPPVDLDCNDGWDPGLGRPLSLTGDVADLTRLISCWQPDADELPPFPPGTDVRPHDVRALAREMAATAFESKKQPPLRCPGGVDHYYFQHLVGQTRWGDLVAVYGACRQFVVADPHGQTQRWWTPSPVSQRILDDLRR